jgi:hypothetical protein
MSKRSSAATALVVFLISALPGLSARAADRIFCSCDFDPRSGYSAVGTRTACSSFTTEQKACKIAFGGTGAKDLLASNIGVDPRQLADQAFNLTMENLAAVRNDSPGQISNPVFLQQAIVVYMRVAYLRTNVDIDEKTLSDLDNQVQGFSKELAGQIADVFSSKREPFSRPWNDNQIDVDRGAVRFIYHKRIVVVASFF